MKLLHQVKALGQQIWLDHLSRELMSSGELKQLIDDGVSGITTNPSIFLKAIENDALYLEEINHLKKQSINAKRRYELLAIKDVQNACDLFNQLYEKSTYEAGYVSIEIDPQFSKNTQETLNEARRLWSEINKPNVMIKIPATDAGIQAFEILISEGINVNITLLFSLSQIKKIHLAYLKGLEKRIENKLNITQIRAVASFFLSRIDSALDPRLPQHLQGLSALSIAKIAYSDWEKAVQDLSFEHIKNFGGQSLSLLWASTGTKNKNYSDVLYVDNLIGQNTINTVPNATLLLFFDHGHARSSLTDKTEKAVENIKEIEALGISLEELADHLQKDGLKQFEEAFQKIIDQLS